MSVRWKGILAATMIGVCSAGLLAAQELEQNRAPIQLHYQWQPGTTYRTFMDMDMSMSFPMGDQTLDQKTHMEMAMSMAASNAGQGNIRLDSKYDRMAMTVDAMGQQMTFDSDTPDAQSPLAMVGQMIGKEFTMTFDEDNQIVEMDMQNIFDAMGMDPNAKQIAGQFMNEEQMSQMLQTWITQFFPEKPVKAGDVWPLDVDWNLTGFGSMSFRGSFTLAGFTKYEGHDCAAIDMNATVDMDLSGDDSTPEELSMLKQMGMSISGGTSSGRIYWDNELGWMRGMTMDQQFTMTMKSPPDGSTMEVPMKQISSMRVEVE